MTSYKNFQSKNAKHTKSTSRTDIYEPAFVDKYKNDDRDLSSLQKNIHKWADFIAWSRWFP